MFQIASDFINFHLCQTASASLEDFCALMLVIECKDNWKMMRVSKGNCSLKLLDWGKFYSVLSAIIFDGSARQSHYRTKHPSIDLWQLLKPCNSFWERLECKRNCIFKFSIKVFLKSAVYYKTLSPQWFSEGARHGSKC